jgi:membrane-associated phospholipid phosphatase
MALRAQLVLVGMLLLFALITLSMVWSVGQRLDTQAFLLFNLRGYHPRWLDRFMWLATQMGSIGAALVSALLFFVRNYRRLAVEIILGTLTLWLLVETIKVLTDRARPFLVLEGTRIVGWQERGRSFPSGHTAQAFFLVTLISHRFQLGMGTTVALYAFAALVGVTRIYVGAHYPRDVIGGLVLGSVWAGLAALVDPYWLGLRF